MSNDQHIPPTPPELSIEDAERLSAYLDNMLSDEERQQLEARLQEDAFLRQELAALRQTVRLLNTLPPLQAPRSFTLSAEDARALREPAGGKVTPLPKRARRSYTPWLLSAAAALLLFVVGVGLLLTQPGTLQQPASDGVAFSATETAAEQEEALAEEAPPAAPEDDSADEGLESSAEEPQAAAVQESPTPPPTASPTAMLLVSTATGVPGYGVAPPTAAGVPLQLTSVPTQPPPTGEALATGAVVPLTATAVAVEMSQPTQETDDSTTLGGAAQEGTATPQPSPSPMPALGMNNATLDETDEEAASEADEADAPPAEAEQQERSDAPTGAQAESALEADSDALADDEAGSAPEEDADAPPESADDMSAAEAPSPLLPETLLRDVLRWLLTLLRDVLLP